ncbi:hypothetical protein NQ318_022291 [Aromia moschata]|uniref:Major facilitator superfamily (MFS) profile domain-containing protein n=1 Tax=Aromia moschata TaxID=1265417 RepID=A0AAV8Z6G0_9CUCU|nr:hypothetical protein NQ318_022291 [Aromia moschata]
MRHIRILTDIQSFFSINNDKAGLLQTAFVISYMLFAPLFGYLGDRYSRRWIMAGGVFLWSLTTLCGSFMTEFWWFLLFRALVGVGEASYSTIAPTIISDYFVGDVRSKMLALFYFAIPVGSGMGYIVGSKTAEAVGKWQSALRVTPALGAVAILFIIFVLEDPERGQSEGSGHMEPTPWTEDIKDIVQNRSFMYSTAGFTCVAFVAGALSWWAPTFIEMGLKLQDNGGTVNSDDVSYKFGIIAMVSGLLGVPFGSLVAQKLRHVYPRIDANICAVGLLLSSPLVFFACITSRYSATGCFTLVFFAVFFLNLTWSVVADILLRIRRESTFKSRHLRNAPPTQTTSLVFGAITVAAGIAGVSLGAVMTRHLKPTYPRIDPLTCAGGLVLSAPLLFATTYACTYDTTLCYLLLFFGQVALNLNWAIVSDILLYVVLPTRRSTAAGFQLLASHALGDAGSPYLIGVLSEAFKISLAPSGAGNSTSDAVSDLVAFKALQYALFSTCFVEVIGGLFFLITAFYILQDKHKVEAAVHAVNSQHLLVSDSDQDPSIS